MEDDEISGYGHGEAADGEKQRRIECSSRRISQMNRFSEPCTPSFFIRFLSVSLAVAIRTPTLPGEMP